MSGSDAISGAASARAVDATTDAAIERAIVALLDARAPGATVCPSDVARRLAGDGHHADGTPGAHDAAWRALMPRVRAVAAALAAAGRLRVTRGGVVVDAQAPGGPIRLGRPATEA